MLQGCRQRAASALLPALLFPLGCAKQQTASEPTTPTAETAMSGSGPHQPVVVCGPEASYGYVAAGGPGFTGPTDTVGIAAYSGQQGSQ